MLAIFAFLIVTRFGWCWASARIATMRNSDPDHDPSMSVRACLAMSFAGVRGAVTLAGILSFPVVLSDGSPFPARELAVILSVGVIILSLIVSSIVLPPILNGMLFPQGHGGPEEELRHKLEAARRAVTSAEDGFDAMADKEQVRSALDRVVDRYRPALAIEAVTDEERIRAAKLEAEAETALSLKAVRAMRDYYFEARRKKTIDEVFANAEIHSLDLAEARLTPSAHH